VCVCVCVCVFFFTDDSIARARNKELQDLNVSQTSSFSDAFINEVDNVEKVSRIRESLHKASLRVMGMTYILSYMYEIGKF
jgi:hypothetical protein